MNGCKPTQEETELQRPQLWGYSKPTQENNELTKPLLQGDFCMTMDGRGSCLLSQEELKVWQKLSGKGQQLIKLNGSYGVS